MRCGTTLLAGLAAGSSRWLVSDLGLHAALAGPLGERPPTFDERRPRRALLAEVLAASRTGHAGPLDLVYKQANLRCAERDALVSVLGPPERTLFCLRDPAGFLASATRKFPQHDLGGLREVNYLGTIAEHERLGGEVVVYHPGVTGEEYARVLAPLPVAPAGVESVRYTGRTEPGLATDQMWEAFRRLAPHAVNAESVPPGLLSG